MSNEVYTYQIIPRRPIRNLIPGKSINKPCSMKLTKEQVLLCMKYGPVFRCMPGKNPVRVTGRNLDSLHISNSSSMIKKDENKNLTVNLVIDNITEHQSVVDIDEENNIEETTIDNNNVEENQESEETNNTELDTSNIITEDDLIAEFGSDIIEISDDSKVEDVVSIEENNNENINSDENIVENNDSSDNSGTIEEKEESNNAVRYQSTPIIVSSSYKNSNNYNKKKNKHK